ncbi:MAG: inositol monophosphatase [Candidatus Pacebacteria bacterium]|nr:inositol monophosphatase [Candidatus Paceibacterota bacterium]
MTEELKFAIYLAKKAGDVLVNGFENCFLKNPQAYRRNEITNMDLESEKMIIGLIKKKYPSHRIISEECGIVEGKSDYVWIIDPLDGTKYYSAGIKACNVLISLWKGNTPLVGVVYLPFTKDIYWAEKGGGAFFNRKKIFVSKVNKFKESVIFVDAARSDKLNKKELHLAAKKLGIILENCYRLRGISFGPLPLCYIAQGIAEAFFDLTGKQKIWDLAPGFVIVKEAGGKITGLDGRFHGQDVSNAVVTNGKIHNEFLKLLNSAKN